MSICRPVRQKEKENFRMVDLLICTGILSIRRVAACLLVASFDLGVAVGIADGVVAENLDAGVLKGRDRINDVCGLIERRN